MGFRVGVGKGGGDQVSQAYVGDHTKGRGEGGES